MSRHTSGNLPASQAEFWSFPEFAARLREERARTGLNQKDFGAQVGATLDSQSRYENGKNQPNAEYLARLAHSGVDALYVLTGERRSSDLLDEEAGEALAIFLALPPPLRPVAKSVMRAIGEEAGQLVAPAPLSGRPTAKSDEKKRPFGTTAAMVPQ